MSKTAKLIIIIVTVIVIAAITTYLIRNKKELIEEGGLGGSLYKQIEEQKEAMEFPETNPFKAETNPLEGVKTNPFEE